MNCAGIALSLAMVLAPLTAQGGRKPLYRDASQPVERRVDDLIGRMTLQEKVAQLSHLHAHQLYDGQMADIEKLKLNAGDISFGCVEGFNLTSANAREAFYSIQHYMTEQTRLGIPVFTVTESLHGSVHDGSTIFPQTVAVGSTFDTELAYQMASAIAKELVMQGVNQTLSPGLDVVRDLRWGRVEEAFGEDPWLVGQMGIAQVRGYLDNGISPMLKPFGPGGQPLGGLNLASVECGERDLRTIHIKPYEMVVKNTDVKAVMSSYNSWNGIPNSASKFLLTDILRDEWGFDGYVYSDWGAVEMLRYFQHMAVDNADAAVQALTAGLDLEASSNCYNELIGLVSRGELDESVIDTAVRRVLKAKFELGLFDNPFPAERIEPVEIHSGEAVALSSRIADESIVLLKNDNGILPLDFDKYRSIAVIGPNADQVQFGDYTWSRSNADGVTPLEGITNLAAGRSTIAYAQGCDLTSPDSTGIDKAVELAAQSDVSIVFVGSQSASLARDYSYATCGEGFDLSSLDLTGVQQELVERVHSTGKPLVVVLVTGKPFAIPWIKANADAVAVQWYGGEKEGDAIARMLFGVTNPSAKLPFSFPQSTGHLPVYYNYLPSDKGFYHRRGTPTNPGRDYVFSNPSPLWAFGHGLSYTQFEYSDLRLSAQNLGATDTLKINLTVKNIGTRAGKEVVQLYVRDLVGSIATPVQQLKGFVKVSIDAGENRDVELKLPIEEMAIYNREMDIVVEDGEFEVQIGSASDDIRLRQIFSVNNHNSSTCLSVDKTQTTVNVDIKERKTVSGEIRDVQATPVTGAKITSTLTGKSVISDRNGKFEIATAENDRLTITAQGFEVAEITVGKRNKISIRMNYKH